jgi:hypothetical protein
MTTKFLIILSILFYQNNSEGQIFKVETVDIIDGWMTSVVTNGTPPFYKIKLKSDDSELGMIVYPPFSEKDFTNSDIEKMIAELLTFKGDTRKCFMKISCTEDITVPETISHYSLQLEALYMINSLFFKDYTTYSPCPILVNEKESFAATDEAIIAEAYAAYEKWFVEIKEIGIGNARAKSINPLEGSSIKWYK